LASWEQSCKIAYPSVSGKLQKIGKNGNFLKISKLKTKMEIWKFLENFIIEKNENLDVFLKISKF